MSPSIGRELVFKVADEATRREGARIFALAMGLKDAVAEDHLFTFSNLLADGRCGYFLGAEFGNRLVGYGALVTYRVLGWIGFMGTDPEMQGQGVGTAFVEKLMEAAGKRGLRSVRLDATDIGLRLYTRQGFRQEYAARRFERPGRLLHAHEFGRAGERGCRVGLRGL